jgi:hypothetical protein
MKKALQAVRAGLGLGERSFVPYATLRIGIAGVLLLKLVREGPGLLSLYGDDGRLPWSVHELALPPLAPRLSALALGADALGMAAPIVPLAVAVLYAVSLLGLLVGWRSRVMAASAWLWHLCLFNSSGITAYGVDNYANIALFYSMWMPLGACASWDARRARRPLDPSPAAGILLAVLRVHMCLAYFSSGYEKARGLQWWNGEAIWRAVMQPQFQQLPMTWLAHVPWLACLMTWSTLVLEIGYGYFIWPRATRRFWVLGMVGLHAGIGVMLGLWTFSGLLITLNLAAFGSEIVEDLAAYVVGAWSRRPWRDWRGLAAQPREAATS